MSDDRVRVCAIGIIPSVPIVYWDYDLDGEEEAQGIELLVRYAIGYMRDGKHVHYCVRKTKNGLHLVLQVSTWDAAQYALLQLFRLTHKNSIMNCRKQRMRISPKWDIHTGAVLSPAPYAISGCEHKDTWTADITDKTKGRLEFYLTYEHTKDVRQWQDGELYLESKGEEIA